MTVELAHSPAVRSLESGPTVEEVLEGYGAEIFGWLLATLSSDTDAADAFSLFSEDLWKSLARHQGRCSMRTWCYMLARCAVSRVLEARAGGRTVALSEAPISGVAAQVREATLSYLRTDVKHRVRSLREQLDPDDQMLLVLRVDKDLGWSDIAIVMFGEGAGEAELARHAARLRKRFERVKTQLRALAGARRPDRSTLACPG
jgi:RNA polymerase sigma-70 factor (ECF subfamily)